MQRGARFFQKKKKKEKKSVPMQRGARFGFSDLGAVRSRRDSAGLTRKRSHAARRSYFSKKSVPMQRGAQSAQRDFGARALPRYVFQYLGLRRFLRVVCFALWRLVFR